MNKPFLQAYWRKLIMANYTVDEAVLYPYLPKGVFLDRFDEKNLVSLVGFVFDNVSLKGISIPFHKRFSEVNLRFYVKRQTPEGWRRGVVFVREIVPLPMVTAMANLVYGERYATSPVRAADSFDNNTLSVEYAWKLGGHWNRLSCKASNALSSMAGGSMEEFIFEHYYGYAKAAGGKGCREYEVRHPRWDTYTVQNFSVDCDFGKSFGNAFETLTDQDPKSVFLAEGSQVQIMPGQLI